jgi:hypothetical protein
MQPHLQRTYDTALDAVTTDTQRCT